MVPQPGLVGGHPHTTKTVGDLEQGRAGQGRGR